MAGNNYFRNSESPPGPGRRWSKTPGWVWLLVVVPVAMWALSRWMLNQASATYVQADAVFYRQPAGQPVLAAVLTRFQAASTGYRRGGNGTTTGTDHVYAAAYELPTGRQLWKTTLEAPDNEGRCSGDMLLLGQSARYLFYVRNGLFTLDKQTGRVVAGPGDYGPASAHLSHAQAIDFPSDQPYRYNDSLQAVLARGTDGLYYAVAAQTLQALAYSPPPAAPARPGDQGDYDGSGGFNRPMAPDYDDWLTAVADDGRRCLALLDDQDTTLAAHDPDGVVGRSRRESVRRLLYQTASDNSGSWQPLSGQVFLFGGLLVDGRTRYRQPADSLSRLRAYQSLRERYPTPYAPLRLPAGGWLVAHKATTELQAPILLTAVTATGQVRWQTDTGYSDLALLYTDQPAGKLYLLGAVAGSGTSSLRQVRTLNLRTGQLGQYALRESNPWW